MTCSTGATASNVHRIRNKISKNSLSKRSARDLGQVVGQHILGHGNVIPAGGAVSQARAPWYALSWTDSSQTKPTCSPPLPPAPYERYREPTPAEHLAILRTMLDRLRGADKLPYDTRDQAFSAEVYAMRASDLTGDEGKALAEAIMNEFWRLTFGDC